MSARINWQDISAEYITSTISLRQLALKYGISYAQVRRKSKADDWDGQRAKHLPQVALLAIDKSLNAHADRMEWYNESAFPLVKRLLEKINDSLNNPLLPQDLNALASAFAKADTQARLILGISTANIAAHHAHDVRAEQTAEALKNVSDEALEEIADAILTHRQRTETKH